MQIEFGVNPYSNGERHMIDFADSHGSFHFYFDAGTKYDMPYIYGYGAYRKMSLPEVISTIVAGGPLFEDKK